MDLTTPPDPPSQEETTMPADRLAPLLLFHLILLTAVCVQAWT
ncbi:hypothetical protein [Nocardiopsis suaedae]|uniref:Uncharacterized protein n=1 Tax=Nocardiopsis suaedae TaxID=3018444 RepID=A0ABT4TP22_9ACTN|nr:hypothetical protein [Nocardiopsis suaedae]MDA2806136.1 hypothetical protein [Nocardiopsis suaedae]